MLWVQIVVWQLPMPLLDTALGVNSSNSPGRHGAKVCRQISQALQPAGSRVCPAQGSCAPECCEGLSRTLSMNTMSYRHSWYIPHSAVWLQLIDGRHYLVRVSVHTKRADLSVFRRTLVSLTCAAHGVWQARSCESLSSACNLKLFLDSLTFAEAISPLSAVNVTSKRLGKILWARPVPKDHL